MKLTAINVYDVDLPVVGTYRMSMTAITRLTSVVVELVTDQGLVGYGEVCPLGPIYQPQHVLGAKAAIEEIAPKLIGLDPTNILQLNRAMDAALNGSRYAKAAIDIAAWDLAGKRYGRRVCDLLGGATGETVPTYYAIAVASPEEQARVAVEKQREGYRRIQIKVGGRDIEEDIEALRRIREALAPGMRIAADGNRGLTGRDTIFLSQRCRDIPLILEQPCSTLDEIANIKGQLCHPVYLDEVTEDVNIVVRSIADRLADGFGMKVTRVGGISAMRTIRDICEARNLPHTVDDNWGGDIIAAACVHVGATVAPRLFEGSWIASPYIEHHYDRENGPRIENGQIKVPTGPGLGITPDLSRFGAPVRTYG
ncbi:mandelate racemase/muconate lactonizing enzyme family protein [Rhizobium leguminosarum]|uniref:mandelate racemase/muconate lactonizing enzyme family protein n=1 Tax=Rhizobium leguminosarum TaxID=384 RepID=UPI00048A0A33|nr:mandelate racemase/muconate lactonizing enzyme family protein [Rhizobium leguminosarum]